MAQGNIIQGQASGKLGDTVLMVRNGTQVSRVYTTSGARSGDAASLASRLQRVRFGSASNQWQLYRYICTRMFRKGRNTNQSDYNYFVKRNIDNLPYFTKLENADGVCCMMPGQFSEGNLGRIELTSLYYTNTSTSRAGTSIIDTINPMGRQISWSSTIGALKAALKTVYVNARKITYLFVQTSEISLSESGASFLSQFFQHYPVVLDLFAESTQGENAMTITAFFASKISEPNLKALFSDQTGNFCGEVSTLILTSHSEAQDSIINALGCIVFASNDLVSDCYTTIIPPANVNTLRGVYSVWGGYRTANALQVACDSYGFQSGVMRDEVASDGGNPDAQINAYSAKLMALDEDAHKDFVDQLKRMGADHTRVVRTVADNAE